MIIKRLVLEDFQIFYGRQRLELGPGLYVFHGENGRGKSTLLNAVHWTLFGSFADRQGNAVSSNLMLNRDAQGEGRTQFSVELLLDDEGREILVRRSYDTANAEHGVRMYVERDGEPLDRHSAEMLLRNLLDEDVARFFLFDGEELRAYEELLFGDQTSADEVRASIEQILGLPALANAIDDLEHVAEAAEREVTKAARREARTQHMALRAQQFEKELDDARAALEDLLALRDEAETEVARANEVLQRDDAARDLLKQVTALEMEIAGLQQQATREVERFERALAESWRDVLASAVEDRRQEIRDALARQEERRRAAATAEALTATLQQGVCSQCGQRLDEDARVSMADRLTRLDADDSGDSTALNEAWIALSAIQGHGRLAEAVEVSYAIRKSQYEAVTKRQELQDMRERSVGVSATELRGAARRRDQAQQRIGQLRGEIDEANKRIADRQSTLKTIGDEIERSSVSEEVAELRRRHEVASRLRDLFEAAKDEFRDALREQVERDASSIFADLTTTPEYRGLRINERYGLETLGPDGEPVPGRSAGQEQIVALSLIGALNRNATRRAPVMMDTPLARLDSAHRSKVLGFLGGLARQVFLLVHSAEVAEGDLAAIRSSIAAEYDLHGEALFRTQIMERRNA